jgi:hypothetical protein
LDVIRSAGFEDVEMVWAVDIFEGASGQASAVKFDTMGANIRARKPG